MSKKYVKIRYSQLIILSILALLTIVLTLLLFLVNAWQLKQAYIEAELIIKALENQVKATMTQDEEVQTLVQTEKISEILILSTKEATYNISDSDILLLEKITFAEAGNQSLKGQVAIAAEVLNRLESKKFPNTIKEILLQPGQYYDGAPKWNSPEGFRRVEESDITYSVKQAVKLALLGEDPTEAGLGYPGAYFHYNPKAIDEKAQNDRAGIINRIQIEDHIFYRDWT